MNENLSTVINPSQKPLIYATSGALEIGDDFEVTADGILKVTGGGVSPGSTINCGSF